MSLRAYVFEHPLTGPLHDSHYMPNAGSSDKHVLDWHEEGIFAPKLQGSGATPEVRYLEQRGNFTRIGDMIHRDLALWVKFADTAFRGDMAIAGLPFPASTTSTGSGAISRTNVAMEPGYTQVGAALYPANSAIRLIKMKNGYDSIALSGNEIPADFEMALSISYRV